MELITVMKRFEMKYILSKEQMFFLQNSLYAHMEVDQYGKTSIASIYYDTPDYRIIRASIEKPKYKEKIRLRSYGLAKNNGHVYLEIKRKSEGVVYKRRVETTEEEASLFLNNKKEMIDSNQIGKELAYFRDFYGKLEPKIMIAYDRTSYAEINGDIRLTIDENPRYRTFDLNLHTSMEGQCLLPPGSAILEIKVQQEMPLWLVEILSKGKIYKTCFSKVGEAYKQIMTNNILRRERRGHYEISI